MGYTLATIAALIILLVVAALFLSGGSRRKDIEAEESAVNADHGLTYEEPQDEGATLPQAREREGKTD